MRDVIKKRHRFILSASISTRESSVMDVAWNFPMGRHTVAVNFQFYEVEILIKSRKRMYDESMINI